MTINLSTQTRKSYTYLILFYDGSFYYGVRLCPKGKTPWQDTEYVGSPITHREKWNTTPFIKFILEVFDDYKLAQEKEKELIRPNLNNPICLNEAMGPFLSVESCRKGGQIVGRKWGSINGRRNVESGQLASISSRGGKISGKINGIKVIEQINSQKWKCLVTGFISTPGPLSVYQKRRGIDTLLRKRIE